MGNNKYDGPVAEAAPVEVAETMTEAELLKGMDRVAELATNRPKTALEEINDEMSADYGGEPFFTLRGQDIFAAPLVRMWAELAVLSPQSRAKGLRAFELANRMEKWSTRKWPD